MNSTLKTHSYFIQCQFIRQFIVKSNAQIVNEEYDTRLICINYGSNKVLKLDKINEGMSKTVYMKNKDII